ncbi:MAG: dTDP-glucose 4,6-dehydratase [Chloroflexota bacterium]|nr:dTDP-glucose 4,6-dehydratase [Chloroflexota bacterium]
MRNLMVTGGAGFIGSNFARMMLRKYPDYHIFVYDKMTYAGNPDDLKDLQGDPRFLFVKGDIADAEKVDSTIQQYKIDTIVNFAAETHVDRSIEEPGSFIQTNIHGVFTLLEATRKFGLERMLHVSTDEVYGAVLEGSSKEGDKLEPRSPYSAAKAGGDLMCQAYFVTHGTPVVVTRGSNTYGPYQYPEKLLPLFITNALEDKALPVYGDGKHVRDWMYVLDHCQGIDTALHKGEPGEIYNVGGGNERENMEVIYAILDLLGKPRTLIHYVQDRSGHDRRYSVDTTRLRGLGWSPQRSLEDGLNETVDWYANNKWWWEKIKSGEFAQYYARMYGQREVLAKHA